MRPTTRHIIVDGEAAPPLPVITFAARQPGPTVVVTANMHGDETTGLFAAHALIERITPAGPGRGTLVFMPSLNPEGLKNASRVVPTDGNDLNRAFPGRRRGRAAERMAERIWRELGQLKPDVVIDLHADSALSIPYALLDRPVTLTQAA
ncbi:MAG: succinylglutamate desuccinylase/aspartoacylase family protein, partial [Myxococcota bacterium]